MMSNLILLEGIELIPVLELEPCKFSKQTRKSPSGTFLEVPEAWNRYWSDSLADSGITGLEPMRRGSWHVPTVNFKAFTNIQRFLEKTFEDWGGIDALSDPDCRPVLNGGIALRCSASDVLIELGCCSDLGESRNWKVAAAYRGTEWQMLWIGHPWLSVRYQSPCLVVSGRHESTPPCDRWAVNPVELERAAEYAHVELERFAGPLAEILPMLGYREDPVVMGRRLLGLRE